MGFVLYFAVAGVVILGGCVALVYICKLFPGSFILEPGADLKAGFLHKTHSWYDKGA